MNEETIRQLYEAYGLKPGKIQPTDKGYRNISCPAVLDDGKAVNIIIYKEESCIIERIKLANKVSDFLSKKGLPARQTIDPRILQLKAGRSTRYCSAYNYLPGNTIQWEAYTKAHLKLLGENLARVHIALSKHRIDSPPKAEDIQLECLKRMRVYFNEPGVKKSLRQKLGLSIYIPENQLLSSVLMLCKTLPDRHMLHLDFVRSNILFTGDDCQLAISGILDLEKTAEGPAILDVARTMAFLLVDCKYKNADQIKRSFLLSGYIRRGNAPFTNYHLSHAGKTYYLLDMLMNYFWLHDLYKFLKHNPYESLTGNEHFNRTALILKERGVIN